MAAISVVTFGSSPHKVNILQNSGAKKSNNRDVIVLRKNQTVLSNDNAAPTNILVTNNAQKQIRRAKNKEQNEQRVSNPTPIAVARRNARERNRVKQVNNGFATLRQHIPPEIAAAFEQSGNGRGTSKKLSKVETLRMAVEYIRSLEEILTDESDSIGNSSVSSGISMVSYPSPNPLSPELSSSNQTYQFSITSTDDDELSINTNSPKSYPQYLRISNSDSFKIVAYEDEENIKPEVNQIDNNMVDSNMVYIDTENLSVFNPNSHDNHHSASLSPDIYSENSLSPAMGIESTDGHYAFTTLPPIDVLQPCNILHNKLNLMGSGNISQAANSLRNNGSDMYQNDVIGTLNFTTEGMELDMEDVKWWKQDGKFQPDC